MAFHSKPTQPECVNERPIARLTTRPNTNLSRGLAPILSRLVLLAVSVTGAGCSTLQPHVTSENPAENIRWPAAYEPKNAAFYVSNRIEIAAPPQVVWAILVQAVNWPQWYRGASNVVVKDSPDGTLRAGSVMNWRTMGMTFNSKVKEHEPPFRLAWESRKAVIRGYHAWLIIPTPEGCRVVTDESFRGFLGVMQRIFQPNKLRDLHQEFLVGLKAQAERRWHAVPVNEGK